MALTRRPHTGARPQRRPVLAEVVLALAGVLASPLLAPSPAAATPAVGPAGWPATTTTTVPASYGAAPSTTSTTMLTVPLAAATADYLDGVSTRVHAAERALGAAQDVQRRVQADQARAAASEASANVELARLTATEQAAIVGVQVAQGHVRDLAVSTYVSGGPLSPINALFEARSVADLADRGELVGVVATVDVRALRGFVAARDRVSRAGQAALGALQAAQLARRRADAAVTFASANVANRTNDLADVVQLLRVVTAAVDTPGTDIPRLVLDAYRKAAAAMNLQGCVISWAALAGIGKVESDHGRDQGAALSITGEVLPPIVGPALNGQNGTQLIPATDGGRWDGDPVYAHAVGPMQFIESTWSTMGRDGNGDGIADPNNIYDAALSTAAYLCRAVPGFGMATDDGLRQAFFAYNHAAFYVEAALALTHAYAQAQVGP